MSTLQYRTPFAAAFVASLLLSGCIERGSAFNDDDDVTTAADIGGVDGADVVIPTDIVKVDTGPGVNEHPVFADLPDVWLEAPTGFCDDPKNQTIEQFVSDGDTIGVTMNGAKVRFLGVDASEVTSNDCYSADAEAALRALLAPDKTVCLYPDPNGATEDDFGRLLRWVYIHHDGKWVMLNHRLVRLGYAKAYHFFLKGRQFKVAMEQAELDSRDEKLGGWKACGWVIE